MDGEPQLLYLEPDDEITSVIRRLRGADAGRVVLVAPGRSRATSSVVALRLLARAAAETGRSVALVADASTRALAGEAGIAAFGSVADATSPTPSPAEPMVPVRAPIHVVRAGGAERGQPPRAAPPTDGLEETVAVHLPLPQAGRGRGLRRGSPRSWWPLLALLLAALLIGAAILPGATVRITPASAAVGPRTYQLQLPIAGRDSGQLTAMHSGSATGERLELVAASGSVTFINWSLVSVEVPLGTQVSVDGTIAFTTLKRIVVPRGRFNGKVIQPGQASVAVIAKEGGPGGNVAAGAINTVDDAGVRAFLRGSPDNPNRLVTNPEATDGGLETPHAVIQQSDVDAVVTAIEADLARQLADALAGHADRVYAGPSETEAPVIEIPPDLVGKEDTPTFQLSGSVTYDRPYVSRADVDAAAREALSNDATATPAGRTIVSNSIVVEVGAVSESGDQLGVSASVRAAAAGSIDEPAIRDRIAGKTVDEARTELADIGKVEVDLWPPWVDRVPRLTFRIEIVQVVPTPGASEPPAS